MIVFTLYYCITLYAVRFLSWRSNCRRKAQWRGKEQFLRESGVERKEESLDSAILRAVLEGECTKALYKAHHKCSKALSTSFRGMGELGTNKLLINRTYGEIWVPLEKQRKVVVHVIWPRNFSGFLEMVWKRLSDFDVLICPVCWCATSQKNNIFWPRWLAELRTSIQKKGKLTKG